MKAVLRYFLYIPIFLFIAVPGICYGLDTGENNERKVLLLIVDRLAVEDLFTYAGPTLDGLIDRGGLGLLNIKGGRVGSESGHLSMGAGSRAAAGNLSKLAFTRDEEFNGYPAQTVYHRYMGEAPLGEVFNLALAELETANATWGYKVVPGALGDMITRSGGKVAVFGNADTDIKRRPGVLTAMDQRGLVAVGNVSEEMLIKDPLFPYGHRIDVKAVTEAVTASFEDVSLVVVDWGDITRIDEESNACTPSRIQNLMQLTFAELDDFLSNFSDRFSPDLLFMMVSPSPPRQYLNSGRQLTPLVVAGGEFAPGLLTGPTTRRNGLVANIDIPATILTHLGIEDFPPHIVGLPVQTVPHAQPREFVGMIAERVAPIYDQRPALLRGYLIFLTLTLFAGALALVSGFIMKFKKIIMVLVEGAMIFPVTLLLLAAFKGFPLDSVWMTATLVIVTNAALLGLAGLLKLLPSGRYVFWVVLGLGTSLLLIADLVSGAPLQQYSFLGYDPAAGARFYGMGNEYMGATIGSAILGTVALFEVLKSGREAIFKRRRAAVDGKRSAKEGEDRGASIFIPVIILTIGFYVGIIFLMASPSYGANVGGTIAAVVAFGLAAGGIVRAATKFNLAPAFIIASLALLIFLFWAFNHFWGSGLHWHLQSFCEMWSKGDLAGVQGVLRRKLAMNIRLLRYSIWSYALVAFMGLMVLLFYYPVGRIKILKNRNRYLFSGIMAIVAGSVAALLLNDSGVVAAATTLLYGVPPLLVYYLGIGSNIEAANKNMV